MFIETLPRRLKGAAKGRVFTRLCAIPTNCLLLCVCWAVSSIRSGHGVVLVRFLGYAVRGELQRCAAGHPRASQAISPGCRQRTRAAKEGRLQPGLHPVFWRLPTAPDSREPSGSQNSHGGPPGWTPWRRCRRDRGRRDASGPCGRNYEQVLASGASPASKIESPRSGHLPINMRCWAFSSFLANSSVSRASLRLPSANRRASAAAVSA